MEEFLSNIQNWATTAGIKILVAILILIVSFAVINRVSKIIEKRIKKLEEKR